MNQELENFRDDVFAAFLSHTSFDGWSDIALSHAAREVAANALGEGRDYGGMLSAKVDAQDLAEYGRILFPAGAADIAAHFSRQLREELAREVEKIETFNDLPVHKRIEECVMICMLYYAAHKDAVRKLMEYLALPGNHARAMSMLYSRCDDIWKIAGDRSSDMNFYSKRMLLGKIYMLTRIYSISDESEELRDTRAFLQRRLKDVLIIPKVKEYIKLPAKIFHKYR